MRPFYSLTRAIFNLSLSTKVILELTSRHKCKFKQIYVRTNLKHMCISVTGVKLWNTLDSSLISCKKFHHFKKCYTDRLLNSYVLLSLHLCLFARSEHRPSTKERHCFLSVAIFSISFQVYPISFVSFSVSLCQVFRGLPLLLFPGGFHVMA